MDDSLPHLSPAPLPERPLVGQTVLVVEDSRFASEALRLLCLRSGARIRRADSIRAARRHLRVYRPSTIIVDLGLPDGNGLDLIEDLSHANPRICAILATSGEDWAADAAIAAGADGFLAKPITSLAVFQAKVLEHMPPERTAYVPWTATDHAVTPDPLAYKDDMAYAVHILSESGEDDRGVDYVAQFVGGVARSANDHVLARAAKSIETARANGKPVTSDVARLAGLVQDRLQARVAI